MHLLTKINSTNNLGLRKVNALCTKSSILKKKIEKGVCFVEIVTTSQSINELNYFPNCDTLQARQPFGNYSVLLYLYFTVIIFLIRLLCVTYRFRTTLTKNKQQFETHGFGCVSQQNRVYRGLFSKQFAKTVFA